MRGQHEHLERADVHVGCLFRTRRRAQPTSGARDGGCATLRRTERGHPQRFRESHDVSNGRAHMCSRNSRATWVQPTVVRRNTPTNPVPATIAKGDPARSCTQ